MWYHVIDVFWMSQRGLRTTASRPIGSSHDFRMAVGTFQTRTGDVPWLRGLLAGGFKVRWRAAKVGERALLDL